MTLKKTFVLTKTKLPEIKEAKEFAREYLVDHGLTPRFTTDFERGKESDGKRRVYILYIYEDERYPENEGD